LRIASSFKTWDEEKECGIPKDALYCSVFLKPKTSNPEFLNPNDQKPKTLDPDP
jgi:hypothetical protein